LSQQVQTTNPHNCNCVMSSVVYTLQHHLVQKVMFVWLVVGRSMREKWRSVSATPGCQSVTVIITGMWMLLLWYADNWQMVQVWVSVLIVLEIL